VFRWLFLPPGIYLTSTFASFNHRILSSRRVPQQLPDPSAGYRIRMLCPISLIVFFARRIYFIVAFPITSLFLPLLQNSFHTHSKAFGIPFRGSLDSSLESVSKAELTFLNCVADGGNILKLFINDWGLLCSNLGLSVISYSRVEAQVFKVAFGNEHFSSKTYMLDESVHPYIFLPLEHIVGSLNLENPIRSLKDFRLWIAPTNPQ